MADTSQHGHAQGSARKGRDSMAGLSDREHTELLMLYKTAVDDIDRTKREQWSQVSAILLAQAGLAGLTTVRFALPGHSGRVDLISGVLTALLVLGLLLIILHQLRLIRLRGVIARYRERLEPQTRALLATTETQPFLRIGILVLVLAVMLLVWYFLSILVSAA
jgi:hypothetical protein